MSFQAIPFIPGPVLAPASAAAASRGEPVQHPRTVKQGPAHEDWERHRATIKRLYLDEDKSLKDVMFIMKNEYDLHGT